MAVAARISRYAPDWRSTAPLREDLVRTWAMVGAVGVILLSGCSASPDGEPGRADGTPKKHRIVLEVVGESMKEADITYAVGAGPREEHGSTLPWQESATSRKLDGFSVLAENTGEDGALTCTITVDGTVRKEVTAKGQFALVACDLSTSETSQAPETPKRSPGGDPA